MAELVQPAPVAEDLLAGLDPDPTSHQPEPKSHRVATIPREVAEDALKLHPVPPAAPAIAPSASPGAGEGGTCPLPADADPLYLFCSSQAG